MIYWYIPFVSSSYTTLNTFSTKVSMFQPWPSGWLWPLTSKHCSWSNHVNMVNVKLLKQLRNQAENVGTMHPVMVYINELYIKRAIISNASIKKIAATHHFGNSGQRKFKCNGILWMFLRGQCFLTWNVHKKTSFCSVLPTVSKSVT